MYLLGFAIFTAVWFGVGWGIWRLLTLLLGGPAARSVWVRGLLVAAWLIAPWGDEIAGRIVFSQLCEAMPAPEWYGPVSVGPGRFFDANGNRIVWSFSEVMEGKSPHDPKDPMAPGREHEKLNKAWDAEFKLTKSTRLLRSWPTPIGEWISTTSHLPTGKVVRRWHSLGSPGGWIMQHLPTGGTALSCEKVDLEDSRPIETWVKF
jgi:hypothetical protein